MVRRYIAILILILLSPSLAFAAEFVASVSSNKVAVGEGFILKLELSGASAKSSPSVSALKKNFAVTGRGQSQNTVITNGRMSSSVSWEYTLTPKSEGDFTVPAVAVETSEGTVRTKPISISVGKASSLPSSNEKKGIIFQAKVNKRSPYKNEPIHFTATLTSPYDLANVELSKLSVKDAIVESAGEPRSYDRVIDGIAVKVIEVGYIITPLKSGKITIPSIVIKGAIPMQGRSRFGSFFDRGSDPFGILDDFASFGMGRLEPFSLASDALALNVKPPVEGVNPWLPATSLLITEDWNNAQTLKVGEPLTRRFTIDATGVVSSQLPSLKEKQGRSNDVKVYADQPILDDSIVQGVITSQRKESYTLIPQQDGKITLPELTVTWWDVKEDKLAHSTIPARVLNIEPGKPGTFTPPAADATASKQQTQAKITAPALQNAAGQVANMGQGKQVANWSNSMLYGIIGVLALLLLLLLLWVVRLHRKIALAMQHQKSGARVAAPSKAAHAVSSKGLNAAATPQELYRFLQDYAQSHWGVPPNASLDDVFAAAKTHNPAIAQEADAILTQLQDALYAEKTLDFDKVKKACVSLLKETKNNDNQKPSIRETLPKLNPS